MTTMTEHDDRADATSYAMSAYAQELQRRLNRFAIEARWNLIVARELWSYFRALTVLMFFFAAFPRWTHGGVKLWLLFYYAGVFAATLIARGLVQDKAHALGMLWEPDVINLTPDGADSVHL